MTILGSFPPSLKKIYDESLANQLATTQGSIGSLNQLSRLLHNPNLLMRPILSKEAESSSQLEGTQASIEDAYKVGIMEQSYQKRSHAQEIINYEQAMLSGLDILKKTKFSNLLIREVYKELMSKGVRGEGKHPGEFRKGDVWIGKPGAGKGEARYVAPDATQVPNLMEDLGKFIESNCLKINPLIGCAVIHHRFEAIHPFEDGNGRTGRLLISLYLISRGLLTLPVLYLSGYFEKTREGYTNALSKVDKDGDWYYWIMYFLRGMDEQAKISLDVGLKIDSLFKESKAIIEKERANIGLIRVLEYMFTKPYITAPILHRALQIPTASAARYLQTLAGKGIIGDFGIHKLRGRKQRVYSNQKLLSILRQI